MKLLLPHRFKKVGVVTAPAGILIWVCLQKGLFNELFSHVFDSNGTAYAVVAILSFFSFLGGIYFITFSKEKIEDEMVQRVRLDSFQFAALAQIICMIFGFLSMLLLGEPEDDGGLLLFFLTTITLFWLCFIVRFNYILHVRFR